MAGFSDIPVRENGEDFFVVAEWFNTIRTKLVNAFGLGGYIAVAADQTIAASAEFVIADAEAFKPLLPVSGSGGAVTTSTTPFGTAHGFQSGKEIVLLGLDDTNTVTLTVNDIAGGFISSRGQLVLTKYKQAIVIYNLTLDRFILQE